jgi:hypothetical protein
LSFARPDDGARAELFRASVPELRLAEGQVKDLVALAGRDIEEKRGTTVTASDITDGLVPAAVRDAYRRAGLGQSPRPPSSSPPPARNPPALPRTTLLVTALLPRSAA